MTQSDLENLRVDDDLHILVIGGSGRVGGSAVCALRSLYGDDSSVKISVGGRSAMNWRDYATSKSLPELGGVNFIEFDINKEDELNSIVQSNDLIINTAGPFQGLQRSVVLEAAMKHGKKYLDVCDDIALSRVARSAEMQQVAKDTNGIAIISTGIWPGCSSLLAQELIDELGGPKEVDKVVFSFYTAGSGGAGPTILSATFLILGEDVLTYRNGQPVYYKSATDVRSVDFGQGIGKREVARLNLIECESCHQLGIENVETFFGTSPPIWNKLFVLMANLIPQHILKDRQKMDVFARFSLPMVRLVDNLVGSQNGIRVDVTSKTGEIRTGILSHNDLEKCVGDAIAAFAVELLAATAATTTTTTAESSKSSIPSGVYFPEEVPSEIFKANIMKQISKDAILYTNDWKM